MNKKVYDNEGHIHFITFSCYKKRRILDTARFRQIVIGILNQELTKQNAYCLGFVIMPDHVHCLLWFEADGKLPNFMKVWKGRTSHAIKKSIPEHIPTFSKKFSLSEPIWQKNYYDFNIHSEEKLIEKLNYIHKNPIRAQLVDDPLKWKHSSFGAYFDQRSVGVKITFYNELETHEDKT